MINPFPSLLSSPCQPGLPPDLASALQPAVFPAGLTPFLSACTGGFSTELRSAVLNPVEAGAPNSSGG